MKLSLFISIAVSLLPSAKADTVVLPSSPATASAPYPFLRPAPVRYQQVYDAGQFLNTMPNGALITRISFSLDFFPGCVSSHASNVQVSFSTTAASASSLSPLFSANEGPDEVIVFSGRLDFDNGHSGYSQNLPFSAPFAYNPHNGNLLMEVKNFTGTANNCQPFPGLDAVSGSGLPINSLIAFSADATTGFFYDTPGGLSTQFTFTPVPEPSVVWLASAAGVAWLFFGLRRTKGKGGCKCR